MTTVVPHSVGGRRSASVSASPGASRRPADPAADVDSVATAAEPDRIDAAARSRRRRAVIVHVALAVALVATVLWSATVGQYGTGVVDSLKSIVGAGGEADVVMWQVRLPRIALALFVGAGLAIAGVALQAVFGNPLAEPGLVGVSSGAAVGAAAVTVAGGAALPAALGATAAGWAIAAGAFAGGVLATAVVAATARGGRDVARIILVGVAVNAVCGGLVSGLTFIAEPAARDRIVFWQMGSFAGGDWTSTAIVAAVTVPAAVVLWTLARRLDLLGLGEVQAGHLGVDVVTLRRVVITLTALVVAVGVAFSGIIVFIGLVVPHALRLILGPGHSALLPASLLGGALVATLADLAARTLVTGADLPLGMLTSLVGGPLFFWLLLRGGRAVRR